MCGGGGGGSGEADEYARYQREEQEQREKRVREGTRHLDRLFEGGAVGANAASSFDPNKTYYDSTGKPIYDPAKDRDNTQYQAPDLPEPGLFGEDLGDKMTRMLAETTARMKPVAYRAKFGERANNGMLFTERSNAQGFDDDFYDQRRDAYLHYANPEVDKQFGDSLEDLTFALSRAGTLNSSTAVDRNTDLERQHGDARRRIADAAEDQSTQARAAVSDERSRLMQLIHATGDPAASLAGVGDVLQTLRANPVYDPIGPVFQNVTAGIGNFAQGQRYADAQRRVDDLFRTPSQGSARTVR
jgi:hypothetical protein